MKPALFIHILMLILVMAMPSQGLAQSGHQPTDSYQVGWDNFKPSEFFVNGLKAAMALGYEPKDTLNVVKVFTTIDSSDVGTTILAAAPELKKVNKVWSSVIKSTKPYVFASAQSNRKRELYPFVGIEEWVYGNEADAIKCMKLLNSGMVGTNHINIRRPPREFARLGTRIYYFYTFPANFYSNLVEVRQAFIKDLVNPEIVR